MEYCDICTLSRPGSRVSSVDVHWAVTKGFDPVRLNLLPDRSGSSEGSLRTQDAWELSLRRVDDWNICNECMTHLGPYLPYSTRSRLGLIPGRGGKFGPRDLTELVEQKMREQGFVPEASGTAPGSQKPVAERKPSEPIASGRKAVEGKACFVATAACGPGAPEVETLRSFRDTVLVDYRAGRAMIGGYERVGPPLARWIEPWQSARWLVRTVLIRPVARLVGRLQK